MILLCAQGLQSKDVAERLGVHEHTVGKWRRRFVQDGIEGLTDEYRAGRPRTVSDTQVAQVVERTLTPLLRMPRTGPSVRWQPTAAFRIPPSVGSGPHLACSHMVLRHSSFPLIRSSSIKYRTSSAFYMSPPDRAIVLCVDEKSQIQALGREQPVLPMAPGVAERRTYTYVRNGTTSLFAALDIVTGAVIGHCYKRHRATEFLDFLKRIDAECPMDRTCVW